MCATVTPELVAEKVFLERSGFSFWAVVGLGVMAPNCHSVAAEQQPWPACSAWLPGLGFVQGVGR